MQIAADNDNRTDRTERSKARALQNKEALAKLRAIIAKDGTLSSLAGPPGESSQFSPLPDDDEPSLAPGYVHEVWAAGATDHTAAMAFLFLNAVSGMEKQRKPCLWVINRAMAAEYGLPYGPGLLAMGIDPALVVLVQPRDQMDALWAIEEGLKTTAFAAVVGEIGAMDLTASRRLSLTARTHGSRCLLLVRHAQVPASTAYSRWQVTPKSSATAPFDTFSPGFSMVGAQLVKHRGGQRLITKEMEYPHAQDHLPVVPSLADRLLAPAETVAKQRAIR